MLRVRAASATVALEASATVALAASASHSNNAHFLSRNPIKRRNFKPISSAQPHPAIKPMSTSTKSPTQIVEHFVLFNIKPDVDSSKVNAMVTNLNGLISLDPVLHITSGPITRTRSNSPLTFTHMLHSRYNTKEDLTAYAQHPNHVGIVKDYVTPIVDDVMAFDWVADDVAGPIVVPPSSAMRITFLKLKEGLGEGERDKILGVVGGIKDKFAEIEQLTYGEGFSPARAKGFSIGSLAVFRGVSELDALDAQANVAEIEKDKVRDLLDGVLVLDYAVPSPHSASL